MYNGPLVVCMQVNNLLLVSALSSVSNHYYCCCCCHHSYYNFWCYYINILYCVIHLNRLQGPPVFQQTFAEHWFHARHRSSHFFPEGHQMSSPGYFSTIYHALYHGEATVMQIKSCDADHNSHCLLKLSILPKQFPLIIGSYNRMIRGIRKPIQFSSSHLTDKETKAEE